MAKYIEHDPERPEPIVEYYFDRMREELGPKRAAEELAATKLEYLRFVADEPIGRQHVVIDEFGGDGKIKLLLTRFLSLIDLYVGLFQQEATLDTESLKRDRNAEKFKMNWLGTYAQFRDLVDALYEQKLVDERSMDYMSAIFTYHFLRKGELPKHENVRKGVSRDNFVKNEKKEQLDPALRKVRRIGGVDPSGDQLQ